MYYFGRRGLVRGMVDRNNGGHTRRSLHRGYSIDFHALSTCNVYMCVWFVGHQEKRNRQSWLSPPPPQCAWWRLAWELILSLFLLLLLPPQQ